MSNRPGRFPSSSPSRDSPTGRGLSTPSCSTLQRPNARNRAVDAISRNRVAATGTWTPNGQRETTKYEACGEADVASPAAGARPTASSGRSRSPTPQRERGGRSRPRASRVSRRATPRLPQVLPEAPSGQPRQSLSSSSSAGRGNGASSDASASLRSAESIAIPIYAAVVCHVPDSSARLSATMIRAAASTSARCEKA
jgi:hypothetical protein